MVRNSSFSEMVVVLTEWPAELVVEVVEAGLVDWEVLA